ncbi:MAG: cell division protein FtsQ/DivIB [Bacteroidia bacterium]
MKLRKIKMPKINWKKIRVVSVWVLGVSGILLTLGFVDKEQQNMKCKGLTISINDENGNEFITKDDVLDLLNGRGKYPVGKRLHDINTGVLEKLICSNSYVANAEVFSTINGELAIDIRQRNPLIRIININDEHFYIDDKGKFMPVSLNYSAPVIAANGFITNTYAEQCIVENNSSETDSATGRPILNQLYELALFLTRNPFWNAQIEQVYVNQSLEMELWPRIGNHKIILGDDAHLEEKFSKLYSFYKEGLNKKGWNEYSVINLKFDKQVVCTRQDAEKFLQKNQ